MPPLNLAELIAQNPVTGCSMAIRPSLLKLALPFPPRLENHDWWLALCAMAESGLTYEAKKLVCYRQHGDNAVGAVNLTAQSLRSRQIFLRQRRVLSSKLIAVEALAERLRASAHPALPTLSLYQEWFSHRNRVARAWHLLTGEFRPKSKKLLMMQLLVQLSR